MIIRFLFIVVFIYLLSFFVRRLFVRPFREGYQEREDQRQRESSRKREGKVSIDTHNARPAHDRNSVGEYIDYEEVKDDEKDSK